MKNCIPIIALATLAASPFAFGEEALTTAPPDAGGAAEMARKLQDPLANITAIMTDNDISFKTGNDDVSYGFSLQPVKAFSFDDLGMNFIARAVVPVLGAAPESQRTIFGDALPAGDGYTWGLSDIQTQFFFSPKSDSAWKWGVGPVISWKTRTDSKLAGAGWGGGAAAVLVGSLTENISTSFIGGHTWGDEDGFSTSFIQPMAFYNFPNAPGWVFGYNNTISYNWNATSGNEWTVPVGLIVGKTFDMGGGYGLDLNAGPYWNVIKPEGAADYLVKFGVTLLFP